MVLCIAILITTLIGGVATQGTNSVSIPEPSKSNIFTLPGGEELAQNNRYTSSLQQPVWQTAPANSQSFPIETIRFTTIPSHLIRDAPESFNGGEKKRNDDPLIKLSSQSAAPSENTAFPRTPQPSSMSNHQQDAQRSIDAQDAYIQSPSTVDRSTTNDQQIFKNKYSGSLPSQFVNNINDPVNNDNRTQFSTNALNNTDEKQLIKNSPRSDSQESKNHPLIPLSAERSINNSSISDSNTTQGTADTSNPNPMPTMNEPDSTASSIDPGVALNRSLMPSLNISSTENNSRGQEGTVSPTVRGQSGSEILTPLTLNPEDRNLHPANAMRSLGDSGQQHNQPLVGHHPFNRPIDDTILPNPIASIKTPTQLFPNGVFSPYTYPASQNMPPFNILNLQPNSQVTLTPDTSDSRYPGFKLLGKSYNPIPIQFDGTVGSWSSLIPIFVGVRPTNLLSGNGSEPASNRNILPEPTNDMIGFDKLYLFPISIRVKMPISSEFGGEIKLPTLEPSPKSPFPRFFNTIPLLSRTENNEGLRSNIYQSPLTTIPFEPTKLFDRKNNLNHQYNPIRFVTPGVFSSKSYGDPIYLDINNENANHGDQGVRIPYGGNLEYPFGFVTPTTNPFSKQSIPSFQNYVYPKYPLNSLNKNPLNNILGWPITGSKTIPLDPSQVLHSTNRGYSYPDFKSENPNNYIQNYINPILGNPKNSSAYPINPITLGFEDIPKSPIRRPPTILLPDDTNYVSFDVGNPNYRVLNDRYPYNTNNFKIPENSILSKPTLPSSQRSFETVKTPDEQNDNAKNNRNYLNPSKVNSKYTDPDYNPNNGKLNFYDPENPSGSDTSLPNFVNLGARDININPEGASKTVPSNPGEIVESPFSPGSAKRPTSAASTESSHHYSGIPFTINQWDGNPRYSSPSNVNPNYDLPKYIMYPSDKNRSYDLSVSPTDSRNKTDHGSPNYSNPNYGIPNHGNPNDMNKVVGNPNSIQPQPSSSSYSEIPGTFSFRNNDFQESRSIAQGPTPETAFQAPRITEYTDHGNLINSKQNEGIPNYRYPKLLDPTSRQYIYNQNNPNVFETLDPRSNNLLPSSYYPLRKPIPEYPTKPLNDSAIPGIIVQSTPNYLQSNIGSPNYGNPNELYPFHRNDNEEYPNDPSNGGTQNSPNTLNMPSNKYPGILLGRSKIPDITDSEPNYLNSNDNISRFTKPNNVFTNHGNPTNINQPFPLGSEGMYPQQNTLRPGSHDNPTQSILGSKTIPQPNLVMPINQDRGTPMHSKPNDGNQNFDEPYYLPSSDKNPNLDNAYYPYNPPDFPEQSITGLGTRSPVPSSIPINTNRYDPTYYNPNNGNPMDSKPSDMNPIKDAPKIDNAQYPSSFGGIDPQRNIFRPGSYEIPFIYNLNKDNPMNGTRNNTNPIEGNQNYTYINYPSSFEPTNQQQDTAKPDFHEITRQPIMGSINKLLDLSSIPDNTDLSTSIFVSPSNINRLSDKPKYEDTTDGNQNLINPLNSEQKDPKWNTLRPDSQDFPSQTITESRTKSPDPLLIPSNTDKDRPIYSNPNNSNPIATKPSDMYYIDGNPSFANSNYPSKFETLNPQQNTFRPESHDIPRQPTMGSRTISPDPSAVPVKTDRGVPIYLSPNSANSFNENPSYENPTDRIQNVIGSEYPFNYRPIDPRRNILNPGTHDFPKQPMTATRTESPDSTLTPINTNKDNPMYYNPQIGNLMEGKPNSVNPMDGNPSFTNTKYPSDLGTQDQQQYTIKPGSHDLSRQSIAGSRTPDLSSIPIPMDRDKPIYNIPNNGNRMNSKPSDMNPFYGNTIFTNPQYPPKFEALNPQQNTFRLDSQDISRQPMMGSKTISLDPSAVPVKTDRGIPVYISPNSANPSYENPTDRNQNVIGSEYPLNHRPIDPRWNTLNPNTQDFPKQPMTGARTKLPDSSLTPNRDGDNPMKGNPMDGKPNDMNPMDGNPSFTNTKYPSNFGTQDPLQYIIRPGSHEIPRQPTAGSRTKSPDPSIIPKPRDGDNPIFYVPNNGNPMDSRPSDMNPIYGNTIFTSPGAHEILGLPSMVSRTKTHDPSVIAVKTDRGVPIYLNPINNDPLDGKPNHDNPIDRNHNMINPFIPAPINLRSIAPKSESQNFPEQIIPQPRTDSPDPSLRSINTDRYNPTYYIPKTGNPTGGKPNIMNPFNGNPISINPMNSSLQSQDPQKYTFRPGSHEIPTKPIAESRTLTISNNTETGIPIYLNPSNSNPFDDTPNYDNQFGRNQNIINPANFELMDPRWNTLRLGSQGFPKQSIQSSDPLLLPISTDRDRPTYTKPNNGYPMSDKPNDVNSIDNNPKYPSNFETQYPQQNTVRHGSNEIPRQPLSGSRTKLPTDTDKDHPTYSNPNNSNPMDSKPNYINPIDGTLVFTNPKYPSNFVPYDPQATKPNYENPIDRKPNFGAIDPMWNTLIPGSQDFPKQTTESNNTSPGSLIISYKADRENPSYYYPNNGNPMDDKPNPTNPTYDSPNFINPKFTSNIGVQDPQQNTIKTGSHDTPQQPMMGSRIKSLEPLPIADNIEQGIPMYLNNNTRFPLDSKPNYENPIDNNQIVINPSNSGPIHPRWNTLLKPINTDKDRPTFLNQNNGNPMDGKSNDMSQINRNPSILNLVNPNIGVPEPWQNSVRPGFHDDPRQPIMGSKTISVYPSELPLNTDRGVPVYLNSNRNPLDGKPNDQSIYPFNYGTIDPRWNVFNRVSQNFSEQPTAGSKAKSSEPSLIPESTDISSPSYLSPSNGNTKVSKPNEMNPINRTPNLVYPEYAFNSGPITGSKTESLDPSAKLTKTASSSPIYSNLNILSPKFGTPNFYNPNNFNPNSVNPQHPTNSESIEPNWSSTGPRYYVFPRQPQTGFRSSPLEPSAVPPNADSGDTIISPNNGEQNNQNPMDMSQEYTSNFEAIDPEQNNIGIGFHELPNQPKTGSRNKSFYPSSISVNPYRGRPFYYNPSYGEPSSSEPKVMTPIFRSPKLEGPEYPESEALNQWQSSNKPASFPKQPETESKTESVDPSAIPIYTYYGRPIYFNSYNDKPIYGKPNEMNPIGRYSNFLNSDYPSNLEGLDPRQNNFPPGSYKFPTQPKSGSSAMLLGPLALPFNKSRDIPINPTYGNPNYVSSSNVDLNSRPTNQPVTESSTKMLSPPVNTDYAGIPHYLTGVKGYHPDIQFIHKQYPLSYSYSAHPGMIGDYVHNPPPFSSYPLDQAYLGSQTINVGDPNVNPESYSRTSFPNRFYYYEIPFSQATYRPPKPSMIGKPDDYNLFMQKLLPGTGRWYLTIPPEAGNYHSPHPTTSSIFQSGARSIDPHSETSTFEYEDSSLSDQTISTITPLAIIKLTTLVPIAPTVATYSLGQLEVVKPKKTGTDSNLYLASEISFDDSREPSHRDGEPVPVKNITSKPKFTHQQSENLNANKDIEESKTNLSNPIILADHPIIGSAMVTVIPPYSKDEIDSEKMTGVSQPNTVQIGQNPVEKDVERSIRYFPAYTRAGQDRSSDIPGRSPDQLSNPSEPAALVQSQPIVEESTKYKQTNYPTRLSDQSTDSYAPSGGLSSEPYPQSISDSPTITHNNLQERSEISGQPQRHLANTLSAMMSGDESTLDNVNLIDADKTRTSYLRTKYVTRNYTSQLTNPSTNSLNASKFNSDGMNTNPTNGEATTYYQTGQRIIIPGTTNYSFTSLPNTSTNDSARSYLEEGSQIHNISQSVSKQIRVVTFPGYPSRSTDPPDPSIEHSFNESNDTDSPTISVKHYIITQRLNDEENSKFNLPNYSQSNQTSGEHYATDPGYSYQQSIINKQFDASNATVDSTTSTGEKIEQASQGSSTGVGVNSDSLTAIFRSANQIGPSQTGVSGYRMVSSGTTGSMSTISTDSIAEESHSYNAAGTSNSAINQTLGNMNTAAQSQVVNSVRYVVTNPTSSSFTQYNLGPVLSTLSTSAVVHPIHYYTKPITTQVKYSIAPPTYRQVTVTHNGPILPSQTLPDMKSMILANLPKDLKVGSRGRYTYTGPDQKKVITNWYIDNTGFHIEGDQNAQPRPEDIKTS